MNNESSETVVSDYHSHFEIGIPCEEASDFKGEPPVYHFQGGTFLCRAHSPHRELCSYVVAF